MRNKNTRLVIGVTLIALASTLFLYRGAVAAFITERAARQKLPKAQTAKTLIPEKSSVSVKTALPSEFNLAIPFTVQAPYGDWNMPYKETCEEASVAMVDAFFKGRRFTKASATSEILGLVEWENQTFGYFEDTSAQETARILQERYGYKNVRVVYDPTLEDIKREVAQGRPVIVPAAGRLLGNRYYRQPGPVYHMLVVRGWTKDGMIITNDPGTKHGDGYTYKPEIFMKAIHDWNGGDVYNGRKVIIIVGGDLTQ